MCINSYLQNKTLPSVFIRKTVQSHGPNIMYMLSEVWMTIHEMNDEYFCLAIIGRLYNVIEVMVEY